MHLDRPPTRRSPFRRGRSALIWGVASFVFLQLGLALSIETWLPELRDPTYGVKLHILNDRIEARPVRPPTVVMVGSSRVEYGLLGQPLEEQLAPQLGTRPIAFNFGVAAASSITELVMTRRLLSEGVRPDLLLIEVLPLYLSVKTGPYELVRLPPERLWLNELPLVARYGGSLPKLRAEWWDGWPAPWYTHRYAILTRLAPLFLPGGVPTVAPEEFDASGVGEPWAYPRSPEEHRMNVDRVRMSYGPWLQDFELGGSSCDALRELLVLCRREHIAAALVMMPEAGDFRDLYPPSGWPQVEAFLVGLSHEFDVPLINARCWVPDHEFFDAHHLLHSGATRFTERLGREHLAPLLAGTRSARRY
jgi:hypothetical protein